MKHFEQLWEEAEKAVQKKSLPKEEILSNLRKLLEIYLDTERNRDKTPVGYAQSAHQKAIGEILLCLANLSGMDSIDVYRALHEALDRYQMRSLSNESNNQ